MPRNNASESAPAIRIYITYVLFKIDRTLLHPPKRKGQPKKRGMIIAGRKYIGSLPPIESVATMFMTILKIKKDIRNDKSVNYSRTTSSDHTNSN